MDINFSTKPECYKDLFFEFNNLKIFRMLWQ